MDILLEMFVVDKSALYVFTSDLEKSVRKFRYYAFALAAFFALIDLYFLVTRGHIVAAVFIAIIFGIIGMACAGFKATVTVSNISYRSDYRILGVSFANNLSIKGWQILHVDYRTLHVVGKGISNPPYIQFYLCARDDGQPQDHFSLAPDLYFDLNHDPIEVASVIKKLKDATGFKLTFGDGPMRDIYPTYKKLYGELND